MIEDYDACDGIAMYPFAYKRVRLPEDLNGESPLHHAVRNDSIEAVKRLLELTDDCIQICKEGQTPFHLAISSEVIRCLMEFQNYSKGVKGKHISPEDHKRQRWSHPKNEWNRGLPFIKDVHGNYAFGLVLDRRQQDSEIFSWPATLVVT